MSKLILWRWALLPLAMFPLVAFSASADQITNEGVRRADAGAASQKQIDNLADQAEKIFNDYKTVTKVVDGLKIYNNLLQKQIDNQNETKGQLRDSIQKVSLIERQIVPMMIRMIDSLEEFVELDVPFLLDERRKRVAGLRTLMERSDVTAAEQFRRVLEAYEIENEFGRTIEAYKGQLEIDGAMRDVDFLRVGRVSLAYQSFGGQHTGAYNKETGQFESLPASAYKANIAQGLKIARKQIAPELLIVPVSAPTEVGS